MKTLAKFNSKKLNVKQAKNIVGGEGGRTVGAGQVTEIIK